MHIRRDNSVVREISTSDFHTLPLTFFSLTDKHWISQLIISLPSHWKLACQLNPDNASCGHIQGLCTQRGKGSGEQKGSGQQAGKRLRARAERPRASRGREGGQAFSAQLHQVSLACCQQQTILMTLATGKLIRLRSFLLLPPHK